MKKLTQSGLFALLAVLTFSGPAMAGNDEDGCTLSTLRGTYVFAATGHSVVAGVAQPKGIVEGIEVQGHGGLSAPNATRSLSGTIARGLVGRGGGKTDATGTP